MQHIAPVPRLTQAHWPADTSRPVEETTVGSLLLAAADAAPGAVALVEGVPDKAARRRWTYAQLLKESEQAARALLQRFEPGERVAVWANNIPEWILLEYGCALANITLVTINPSLRPQELVYVLAQSKAAGIFLVDDFRGNPMEESLESVRPGLNALREVIRFRRWPEFLTTGSPSQRLPTVVPDDIAQIQYTSGTTGYPKGAMLHHRGVTNSARFYVERLGVEQQAAYVNPMPLFHVGGSCMAAVGCLPVLATHVLPPYFDPGLILELIESERGQIAGGVPTMVIAMMGHPDFGGRDLSSLQGWVCGGSSIPEDLVRRIEQALGVPVTAIYGMTEGSSVITQTRPDDSPSDKATTIGQPLPQVEVKIANPGTGGTKGPGEVGELWFRGYQVMREYFEMPKETATAIEDGWLRSGDLASMDERGYCRIEGRLKDMIRRGAENIYPRQIENVLFTHPSVADVAVVGIPDSKWGEEVAAFIRPAAGGEPAPGELLAFCRERISAQKTPRIWVLVEEFPMTASGKVQKFVLRDRLVNGELKAHATG
jgi:fatty-acyl-CoA synthase